MVLKSGKQGQSRSENVLGKSRVGSAGKDAAAELSDRSPIPGTHSIEEENQL